LKRATTPMRLPAISVKDHCQSKRFGYSRRIQAVSSWYMSSYQLYAPGDTTLLNDGALCYIPVANRNNTYYYGNFSPDFSTTSVEKRPGGAG
jgi:hypothetical protein